MKNQNSPQPSNHQLSRPKPSKSHSSNPKPHTNNPNISAQPSQKANPISKNNKPALILLLLLLGFWLIIQFSHIINNTIRNIQNNNANTKTSITTSSNINKAYIKKHPVLEIQVVDYPKQINLPCQPITITFKAKNIGKKALSYQDILDKKYDFAVEYGSDSWPVWNKNEIVFDGTTALFYNSKLEDFGTIKPGQTKTIVLKSAIDHGVTNSQGRTYYITNVLADEMRQHPQDKALDFRISFNLNDSAHNRKPRISESNAFTVKSSIFDANGDLKECYGKL